LDLKKLINKSNPVIFDIGCNNGSDTANFCQLFPNGKIYAFEPDQAAISAFYSRQLKARLIVGAVSDVDGNTDFYPSENWNPSGSILKPKLLLESHAWIVWMPPVKVPSIRLDTFTEYNKIDLIDFVWADVQGAEEKMIKGGINTFTNRVRYLYTEYSIGELYETAATKERILELLPDYKVLELMDTNEHGGNMLLRNMKL
jgi:2-O-methyltransferase